MQGALIRVLREEAWRERAACRGMPPRWWFPDESYPERLCSSARVRRARAVCASCEVSPECLRYALVNGCEGIWAGTTTADRQRYADRPLEQRVSLLLGRAATIATTGPLRVAETWRGRA